MNRWTAFISAYLIIVNLIGFVMMGVDKRRAGAKRRRIREKTLFAACAAGGAAGVWAGMRQWRHKTKHRRFVIGVPALLLLNIAVFGWLLYASAAI
ncbi:DUF1294 domain-containing protein [Paenibacillus cisolokensis]|uniref:DUF1294 domain-containing protein n=1 Tax=Paenibacillus cisolokensis TaxID=1658519 RepID=UPI003D2713DF